jgi:hypothetical protein
MYGYYDNSSGVGLCTLVCSNGYYSDLGMRECMKCIYPCELCQYTADNCIACVRGYIYYNGVCTNLCPNGYYNNNTYNNNIINNNNTNNSNNNTNIIL